MKNRPLWLGHRVVQIEPNLVWSIPRLGRLWDKRNFGYSLPTKKVSFPYGTLRISRITNFKNRSFSSGQGVVQIQPNPVWSITFVPRMQNKKNFCYSLSRKNVSISYGSMRISRRITNFKNRSFLSDQGVVQSEPNWYPRLPVLYKF